MKIRYFGDYELLEEIARGGMGVVYKARQTSLNRTVALKMILAGQLASEDDVKRFYTEAEAAANLKHPNLVTIHEVGEHEGQHYFSMDYIEGKSLAELTRQGPVPPARAAEYLKTISEAIDYAHERGTLHRDIKPSNVLVDERDRVHVTDFGLARRLQQESGFTQSGTVMGTPSYMPPEQAAGQLLRLAPESDVYSLGATLYELLTGRPPFHGDSAMDVLLQVRESEPIRPRSLNPQVPQSLETVCLKCLEKRIDRRYSSAGELAEDLGRFLNREPIHARPVSFLRRVGQWARHRPWLATGVASVLVVALLCLVYGLWTHNRYLLWLNAHPDHVREAGIFTEQVE